MTAPGAPTPEQLHTFEATSDSQRALFAVAIAPNGDAIARYGMRGDDQRGNFRAFAISGPATLALNFQRGRGWAVEPT